MRVLVCGGRNYRRREMVWRTLDRVREATGVSVVVHGAATGADTFAGEWARERGIPEEPYPILKGESGFDRNGRMLFAGMPEMCIYFPGGNGTQDMVKRAQEAGVPLHPGLVDPDNQMELEL